MSRGRGRDFINVYLPDELLIDIFHRIEESKSTCDAISLVCRRWRRIERESRRTIRIGASGDADRTLQRIVGRFLGLRTVFVDERMPPRLPSYSILTTLIQAVSNN